MLKRISVILGIALATLLVAGLAYASVAPSADDSTSTMADDSTTATTAPDDSTTTTAVPDDSTSTMADDPTTTATAPDDPTTTTTTPGQEDGQEDRQQTSAVGGVFQADEAGTVEIAIGDGGLELVAATPAPGFEVARQRVEPDAINVKFRSGSLEVEFEAELEHGALTTKVERGLEGQMSDDASDSQSDDDGSASDDHSTDDGSAMADMSQSFTVEDAGTVTVTIAGGQISIEVAANPGWEFTTSSEHDEAKVEFRNDTTTIEFEAEIEHGELKTKTEVKTDEGQMSDDASDSQSDDDGSASDDHSTDDGSAMADMSQSFTVEDAGTVTVTIAGGQISIEVAANPGWEFTTSSEHNGAKVEFRNDTTTIEFEAEIEHGELKTKTEVKTDD